jgi:predicted metal-dependent RNase
MPFAKGDPRINRTKAGPGRTPDKIRAALRNAFDKRREILEAIADDTNEDPNVRMKAMEMLAKYGLGAPSTALDSEGNQTDIPLLSFKPAE